MTLSFPRLLSALAFTLLLPLTASAQEAAKLPDSTRLLRFPTTNGSQIVFDYAGQLYTVDKAGGTARRLTSGPGYNSFPRFSPDGQTLAFTGQYDGNTEVYTMPADGGTPKRLTTTATLGRDDISDRMGPNNLVMAWQNTKPLVVFRSRMKSFNSFIGQLFTVGNDAELPQQLPVPRGGFVSFSPDDSKMAYNRVFREFRTWKHYRGGMADDIWIYDFKTGETTDLTNNPAQDIIPMWGPDNKIYFLSDRDGRLNLFSHGPRVEGNQTVDQLQGFRREVPLHRQGRRGLRAGRLHLALPAGRRAGRRGADQREGGFRVRARCAWWTPASTWSASSPPRTASAWPSSRAATFSPCPPRTARARNLTNTSNAHERDAVWSPDGKSIAYLSDATGENELYVRSQDGKGEPQQITHDADTYYYSPIWSPDSKKLLWSDRLDRLRFVDLASKAVTESGQDKVIRNPRLRLVARQPVDHLGAPEETRVRRCFSTASTAASASRSPTAGTPPAARPSATTASFSCSARRATSSRPLARRSSPRFTATWSAAYWSRWPRRPESPLKPRSDEVGQEDKKDETSPRTTQESRRQEGRGQESPRRTLVDEDGLKDRLDALPVPSGNYGSLRLVDDRVFYLRTSGGDDREARKTARGTKATLASYSLKDRKETVLGKVSGYEITRDGKKMLVKIDKDYSLIDLPKDKLDTQGQGQARRPRQDTGPPRRVEGNLRRILAADARLLLRAQHERRRLEGHARQVRRAGAVREQPQRPDLPARRSGGRAEQRPLLRRRRRAP